MKIFLSPTWVNTTAGITLKYCLREEGVPYPSFHEATNETIVKGNSLIDRGLRNYKLGNESTASAELELGRFWLYAMSAVDSLESRNGIKAVANDESIVLKKQELNEKSRKYFPLIEVLYGKKLVVFMNLFSLDQLMASATTDEANSKVNRTLDRLLSPHMELFRQDFGQSGDKILHGIKANLFGHAYKIRKAGPPFNITLAGEPFAQLLRELEIPQVPLNIYDNVAMDQYCNQVKQFIASVSGSLYIGQSLRKDEIGRIIALIDGGEPDIKTQDFNTFYGKFNVSSSQIQVIPRPLANVQTIIPVEEVKEPVQTFYEAWLDNGTEQLCPFVLLEERDVEKLVNSLNCLPYSNAKKGMLKTYFTTFEMGALPITKSIVQHHKDLRIFEELNDFLRVRKITPLTLFSQNQSILKKVYSAHRKTEKDKLTLDELVEMSGVEKKKIALLIEGCKRNEDCLKLFTLDPEFGEILTDASLEDEAVCFLLESFREIPKKVDTSLKSDEPTKDDSPPLISTVEPNNGLAKKTTTPNNEKKATGTNGAAVYITQIRCPVLETIGFEYDEYKERFPTKQDLVRRFIDVGDRTRKNLIHRDIHDMHMARFVLVDVVLSNGRHINGIRIKRAEVIHALKEIKEAGKAVTPESILKIAKEH